MPVGKNSIKRAVSNGYSNVQTSAPDMEHSEVLVNAKVKFVLCTSGKLATRKIKTPKGRMIRNKRVVLPCFGHIKLINY